ncbi:MAG: hypothetical protein IPJ73_13230 [Zoogloea sp.]|nr:hypothetical protein [Zoogloea sp.]
MTEKARIIDALGEPGLLLPALLADALAANDRVRVLPSACSRPPSSTPPIPPPCSRPCPRNGVQRGSPTTASTPCPARAS